MQLKQHRTESQSRTIIDPAVQIDRGSMQRYGFRDDLTRSKLGKREMTSSYAFDMLTVLIVVVIVSVLETSHAKLCAVP